MGELLLETRQRHGESCREGTEGRVPGGEKQAGMEGRAWMDLETGTTLGGAMDGMGRGGRGGEGQKPAGGHRHVAQTQTGVPCATQQTETGDVHTAGLLQGQKHGTGTCQAEPRACSGGTHAALSHPAWRGPGEVGDRHSHRRGEQHPRGTAIWGPTSL